MFEQFFQKINVSELADQAAVLVITYVPQFILAIITLIVGLILARFIVKMFEKILSSQHVEKSLIGFLTSMLRVLLKVLVIISFMSMLGVEMTVFVTMIGAAGLAIGLALQGSLSNFAGGVLILFFKYFRVGDTIEAQGHTGTVQKIEIITTILKTGDNRIVTIPNGNLSNGAIVNHTREKKRRADFVFGVGYDDKIDTVTTVLEDIAKNHTKILQDPAPSVYVSELGDSCVNFTVKVWTNTEDFWPVKNEIPGIVKKRFDKEKISMPNPQQDVHIYKEE